MKLIAITGGIGSGKSVVSQLLRVMGYPVYDCDSHAKLLMAESTQLKLQLQKAFGEDIVVAGEVQRQKLSKIVFADKTKLMKLNSIVHPNVRIDIQSWAARQTTECAFVETAILSESGVDKLVDAIWLVEAPTEIRIKRVMARNNLTEEEVKRRINSQNSKLQFAIDMAKIENYGDHSIIKQVTDLINE